MLKPGTVVLVNDDLAALESLGNILSVQGFLVEAFTDGEQAKERIEHANGSPVGLAIVDLHMSCINGAAFAAWTHSKAPHVEVIFTSTQHPTPVIPGYRVFPAVESWTADERRAFLDLAWDSLRSASSAAGALSVQKKLDQVSGALIEHMESEGAARAETSKAIQVCSEAINKMGHVLTETHNLAKQADEDLRGLTPARLVERWWEGDPRPGPDGKPRQAGVDPLIKRSLPILGTIVGGLVTLSLTFGTWIVTDLKEKVVHVLGMQDELEKEIKPALRDIRKMLAARRPSPAPSPAPSIAASPSPAPVEAGVR